MYCKLFFQTLSHILGAMILVNNFYGLIRELKLHQLSKGKLSLFKRARKIYSNGLKMDSHKSLACRY